MPSYGYDCAGCGPFTLIRPMAESAQAQPCPACGGAAPRSIRAAPAMALMDPGRRVAHATNERSASAPRAWSRHGAGCRCCAGGTPAAAKPRSEAGPRPGSRPWMLGH